MPNLLIFVSLAGFCVACQQPSTPALPNQDYAVYAAVLDRMSYCNDTRMSRFHNKVFLLNTGTETPRGRSFDFSFPDAQRGLPILLQTPGTFYTTPAWSRFISSVDTAKFGAYQIQRPVRLTCGRTVLQTNQQLNHYFSTSRDGYGVIGSEYPDFGGIVQFSKVIYSDDARKALCYYSNVWGPKEGLGSIIFLEKKGVNWSVVGIARVWIA